MAKMSIGGFRFPHNPSRMTVPEAKRSTAKVKTITDIAFFSFGTMINGLEMTLEWDFMRANTYASIHSLIMADTGATFNPQDGLGTLYDIEFEDIVGDLHLGLGQSSSDSRKNVKLVFTILRKA